MKLIYFLFFIFSSEVFSQVLLIDPGHGGLDTGATATILKNSQKQLIYEKDLALTLALKLKEKLKNNYQVYLTRSFDRGVGLDQRAQMAEKVQADLIISLHMNAEAFHQARGMEIYYLDNHDDMAVKKIETVENKTTLSQDKSWQKVLNDILVQGNIKKSQKWAMKFEKILKEELFIPFRFPNRGVKAGMFYVLALSKRPGLLIEVGFISHPQDLKQISNETFQEAFTRSVERSLKAYFSK